MNAFITLCSDSALQEAAQAESEIRAGRWRGPLHGIPVGLKDLIDTAGVRTTAASAVYEQRVPSADAELVTRLKDAGAILIGKQNLHEFAYGGSNVISHFGPVRNPVGSGDALPAARLAALRRRLPAACATRRLARTRLARCASLQRYAE